MSFQFLLGLIRQILLIPPFMMWRNWIAGSKSLTRVTLLAWEIVAYPAQDQMPELSKTCSNLIFAFCTNFLAYCTNFLNRGQQTTARVPILPTTCCCPPNKNSFYIVKCLWEEKEKWCFCDTWQLYKIQIAVSINTVLWKHSHSYAL